MNDPMAHTGGTAVGPTWPRPDVVDTVTRAHRLGYCRRRVATALAATEAERAAIEARCAATEAQLHHHGGR